MMFLQSAGQIEKRRTFPDETDFSVFDCRTRVSCPADLETPVKPLTFMKKLPDEAALSAGRKTQAQTDGERPPLGGSPCPASVGKKEPINMSERRKSLEQGARRLNRSARDKMRRPDMVWFVVFALSGQEFAAQKLLRHWGASAYLPLRSKWRRLNRYQRVKERVAYPAIAGSLFVGFPSHEVPWFDIFRSLPSVYGVLGVTGKPVAIPGERLAQFVADNRFKLSAAEEEKHMRTYHEFAVGDRVGVVDGPFAGHVAKVEKIDGSKAHMLIHLLGGIQEMAFPVGSLEKAA